MAFFHLNNIPSINGVKLIGEKTNKDLKISEWSSEKTLTEGTTSVTFTGLNTNYAYDLYFNTANGSPLQMKDMSMSGTSITYTIKPVTSGQAGTSGTGCRVKLRCLF